MPVMLDLQIDMFCFFKNLQLGLKFWEKWGWENPYGWEPKPLLAHEAKEQVANIFLQFSSKSLFAPTAATDFHEMGLF